MRNALCVTELIVYEQSSTDRAAQQESLWVVFSRGKLTVSYYSDTMASHTVSEDEQLMELVGGHPILWNMADSSLKHYYQE